MSGIDLNRPTSSTDNEEDPLISVYKAIVDNPDFINQLADVLRANLRQL